jgi:hypothetical protein
MLGNNKQLNEIEPQLELFMKEYPHYYTNDSATNDVLISNTVCVPPGNHALVFQVCFVWLTMYLNDNNLCHVILVNNPV